MTTRIFAAGRTWAACAALMAIALSAAAADYEHNVPMVVGADADIRLTVPGGRAPQAGFLPMRIKVVNRHTAERTWRLEAIIQLPAYGSRGGQQRTAHELTVPGSETREFFTFTPVPAGVDFRGVSMVQIEVEGPSVQNSGRFMLGLGYGWNPIIAPVAVEPALEPALAEVFNRMEPSGAATPAPRRRARPGRPVPASLAPTAAAQQAMERVALIDPAAWPADPRLWSSFGAVLLEESTWDRLDSARRQALLDWAALGGRVILSPAAANDGANRAHGAGWFGKLPRPLEEMSFGEVNVYGLNETRFTNAGERLGTSTFWDLEPAKWNVGTKAGWLTGFVIVFGVLIAPVNLFYFAPPGRRHRLFFTVPLLSVAASALLFLVITVSDGFGGRGARRTVVVLLPEQNRAAVFQRQISRTGLLGGRDFKLPADAWINREADGSLQMSGRALELRRDGDEASGDWFSSRAVQTHELRRLIASRERVELVSELAEPPVVQSTVGTTLRQFGYLDEQRRFWYADEVPPGTRVALKRQPTIGPAPISEYAAGWSERSFYALGGPTAEVPLPTLGAIRWDPADDRVLYTGTLRRTEAAP